MPPDRAVALDREHVAVASSPRLDERVRQQRQGAGLVLHVGHQHIDQAGFDAQPCFECRILDRRSERVAVERGDEVQRVLGGRAEVRVGGEVGQVIGAHHDDDRGAGASLLVEHAADTLAPGRAPAPV